MTDLKEHIDSFRRMGIAPRLERRILRELYSHLEEEAQELEAAGVGREEAVRQVMARFGPPREIARRMADLYARGSFGDAFLGGVPHLLIAFTFLFHLWQSPSWVLFLAALTGGLALYGWGRGKPVWFYPWLGYSLAATLALIFLALVLGGWALSHLWGSSLTSPWLWGVVLAYSPLALGLLLAVASRVARQDWLNASLMFLPLPILAAWALRLQGQGKLLEAERHRLQDMDPGMGLLFIALALAVAAFIRMRRRLLKIAWLLSISIAVVSVVTLTQVSLDLGSLFLLASSLALFFLIPALVDRWMGPGEEPWAQPSWADQVASQGWHRAL